MSDDPWLDVISRVSTSEPVDLDLSVFSQTRSGSKPASMVNSDTHINPQTPPSVLLWKRSETGKSYIGVRVNERLSDCTEAAFRLAAAALERDVIPIILTTLSDSGFERFGFRVERIIGANQSERQVQEAELKQFWNLAIIIDVTDVTSLG